MIGFEHIPANFYICEIGLLAARNDVTFEDVLVKNWIPVTLGNFVAGAAIVAFGYSYVWGRVGPICALIGTPAPAAADAEAAKAPAKDAKKADAKKADDKKS